MGTKKKFFFESFNNYKNYIIFYKSFILFYEKIIAIVVLTWNDHGNTKKCIKSIYPQLNAITKLILVDNNSENKVYNQTLNWINYNKQFLELKNTKILKYFFR